MKDNLATIKGRVLSVTEFKNLVYIHLFVKNGPAVNFPSVTCTTAEMKEIAKKLNKDDYVLITGRVGLRPKDIVKNGEKKTVYQNNIVAESITIRDPFTETSTSGRLFNDDSAELIGRFKILFLKKVNDNTVIINATDDARHVNLTRFSKSPESFMERYPIGSEIIVKASIQTQRRETDGEKKHFTNLVITDIKAAV